MCIVHTYKIGANEIFIYTMYEITLYTHIKPKRLLSLIYWRIEIPVCLWTLCIEKIVLSEHEHHIKMRKYVCINEKISLSLSLLENDARKMYHVKCARTRTVAFGKIVPSHSSREMCLAMWKKRTKYKNMNIYKYVRTRTHAFIKLINLIWHKMTLK